MNNDDNLNIRKAEGGFIVTVTKEIEPSTEASLVCASHDIIEMVFTDTSKLMNFLDNELVGSN